MINHRGFRAPELSTGLGVLKTPAWNSPAQNEPAHAAMVREVQVVNGPARTSFGKSLQEKLIVPLVPDVMF